MKKYLLLTALLITTVFAQDAARILTGSAQPPLPFNIITQPGFENRTLGWSVTGGTFTTTSATANVGRGKLSAQWTLPVSAPVGTVLQSDLVSIPAGLYARTCRAAILYKGNVAATYGDLYIEAYDGTSTYGSIALSNSATYVQGMTSNFTCPSSGSIRLRIRNTSTGNASPTPLYFDEAYIADSVSIMANGVSNIGTFGSIPTNNGATISGSDLILQPADGTHPGALTAGAQSIGGAKTFVNTAQFSDQVVLAGTTGYGVAGVAHNAIGGLLSFSKVVSADITDGTILDADISNNTITGAKISSTAAISSSKLDLSNITQNIGGSGYDIGSLSVHPASIRADEFDGNLLGDVTGSLFGDISGNAATATALAANPTDCSAGTFASAIDAMGNLSCAIPTGTNVLTTKGDLYTFGSSVARLPVGTNGFTLFADSSQANGIKWGAPASSGSGMVVGQPVSGAAATSALSTDASGNLKDMYSFMTSDVNGVYLTPSVIGRNITNVYGLKIDPYFEAPTAITNAYGIKIDAPTQFGGDIPSNFYGLHITDPAGMGATAYPLYVSGGTSYFGGNIVNAKIFGTSFSGIQSLVDVTASESIVGTRQGQVTAGKFLVNGTSAASGASSLVAIDARILRSGADNSSLRGAYIAVSNTSSATTGDMTGVYVAAPSNSGTVDNSYTVRILGANTGTVTTKNYSLYVDSGSSYFGGLIIPSAGIQGTATNDSATAGNVGESASYARIRSSAQSIATTTPTNISSGVTLTAGDWDVSGTVCYTMAAATYTGFTAGISDVSGTLPSTDYEGWLRVDQKIISPAGTSGDFCISVPTVRVLIASTTVYYLVGQVVFTAGSAVQWGHLAARRMR